MSNLYGSLMNRICENAKSEEEIKVGMGATIYWYSDRTACTVVEVKSKCSIVIQRDIATRIDNRGMCENQEYEFSQDENGRKYECYCRNGVWKTKGDKQRVVVGKREEYYDYSL